MKTLEEETKKPETQTEEAKKDAQEVAEDDGFKKCPKIRIAMITGYNGINYCGS